MTLKRIRKAKGLSQYALAKATKPPVSREYIRKLEAGESDPTIGMLQRLANALEVSVTDLLGMPPEGRGSQSQPNRRSPRRPQPFAAQRQPPEETEGMPPGRGHQPKPGEHPGLGRNR